MKTSYVDLKITYEFYKYAKETHSTNKLDCIIVTREDKHDYSGILLDYLDKKNWRLA